VDLDAYPGLLLEPKPNGVLLITINRPQRYNAVDDAMHEALGNIWADVDADPDIRVSVITGAGKAFSAGGDLEMDRQALGDFSRIQQTMRHARDLVVKIVDAEKPIVSAINGAAVGAGLAVALLADISIIGDEVRLTDGHARVGIAAGDHAAIVWPLLCGIAKAKYYLLTADFIEAAEAERIGLVSKCVPQATLLDEAQAVAAKLALGPQLAIRATKRSLNHWLRDARPAFEHSLAMEMLDMFGPDAEEGFRAMIEKRPPNFSVS
jgi:enoyl-CoA hydratase